MNIRDLPSVGGSLDRTWRNVHTSRSHCTDFSAKPVQDMYARRQRCVRLVPWVGCAHAEDVRSCRGAQCEPEYAPCLGAPLRLSKAAADGRQASALHPWRGRRAARCAAGGPVDLLCNLACARVAEL